MPDRKAPNEDVDAPIKDNAKVEPNAETAQTAPVEDDQSPQALLEVALAAAPQFQLVSKSVLPQAYDNAEFEAAFQATFTRRRLFCIAILCLWAGSDNLLAGVIDYANAGVGVLAGAASIGFGLIFCSISLVTFWKRKGWQYNHSCVLWLGFILCLMFMITVCANAVARYHLSDDHDKPEAVYFGYHAAGLITIACYLLANVAAPLFMFCLPYLYAVLICSSPWAWSVWLIRFCFGHLILFTAFSVMELRDQRVLFQSKVELRREQLKIKTLHKDEQRAQRHAAEEAQQRIRDVHAAKESTYTSLLRMLSHDFKGTVLNLESQLSQLEGHAALTAELHHILHSIMSIKYRYTMEPLKQQVTDTTRLNELMNTMELLFNDVTFKTMDIEVAIMPCLLHLVVHQLLRNAHIHGGGEISCTVTVEGEVATISTHNLPGPNHDKMIAAGSGAMELALSREVGVVSSSGLGLEDIMHIIQICNCNFSIDWNAEGVLAQVRIPVVIKPTLNCLEIDSDAPPIRVCVIDDQMGPRMGATKLLKMINPDYEPPAKLRPIKALWEDELVKVAGADLPEVEECVEWINTDPMRTMVFLDRMLEFPTSVVDGLSLIPELSGQGALVILRSGNASDEDRALYTEQGAFGCIGKVLHGGLGADIIEKASRHIADRLSNRRILEVPLRLEEESGAQEVCSETEDISVAVQL